MDDIQPFFNRVIENEITYYVIPANTPLFRGDVPENYEDPLSTMNGPIFFGESADVARIYGLPFEYKTTNEVKLLALDRSMETIYNAANPIIKSILKKNYGYPDGYRNSEDDADKQLTQYICNAYGGYALDYMPTEGGGKFHREIILCDKTQVEFVNKVMISQAQENTIIDNHKMRKAEQERIERKKRPRVYTERDDNDGSYLHMGSLFGDEPNTNVLNTAPIVGNNNEGNTVSNSRKIVVNKSLFNDDEDEDDEAVEVDVEASGYNTPGGKHQQHKKKTMRRNKKNSKKRQYRRKTNKQLNNSKRRLQKRNNKTSRK
jgi:hypothetical protein